MRSTADFVTGSTVVLVAETYYGQPLDGQVFIGQPYVFEPMQGAYVVLRLAWSERERNSFTAEQVQFRGNTFSVTFGDDCQYSRIYGFKERPSNV